jgi:epoxyqueuosine reductase
MATTRARRADPKVLWPDARTVIALGANYGPDDDPLAVLADRGAGAISVYARNRDYHDVLKKALKELAGWIARTYACEVKLFVDTAPVMEKPLAAQAGLGWQGKHTNLVSRRFGSWLFLGEVFTTLALPADAPERDFCGSCDRCRQACPTGALTAPYRIDARRCISYLTIEHKGHIAREFRQAMGNRIYGCDDCLAVCPWNKFAEASEDEAYRPPPGRGAVGLAEFASLDDAAFRSKFARSPILRTGRDRFLRNVLVAIGNSDDPGLASAAMARLDDTSALVRAMAVWALARLLDANAFAQLRRSHLDTEADAYVRAEWRADPAGPEIDALTRPFEGATEGTLEA